MVRGTKVRHALDVAGLVRLALHGIVHDPHVIVDSLVAADDGFVADDGNQLEDGVGGENLDRYARTHHLVLED